MPATRAAAGDERHGVAAMIEHRDTGPRQIIVTLDGSRRAARAILPARRLAAALGLPIGAITVAGPRTELDFPSLETLQTKHRLHWVDVVQSSSAAAGIAAAARERDALVVMATGSRNRSVAMVGSTASSVVKHAARPVMLVGPGTEISERRPIKELVVAVSGTTSGEVACEPAVQLAEAYGFDLRFVTVVPPTPAPADPQTPSDRKFGPVGDEHDYIADLVARHQSRGLHLEGSVIYDPLSPAGGLAHMMRHHPQSLLVVGTSGRDGLARLRHGSVASTIVSESPVPSIMVPTNLDNSAPQR